MSTTFTADRDLFTGARENAAFTAYRDPLERARATFAELVTALEGSVEAAEVGATIRVRRVARVTFGAIGIGGAFIVSALAAFDVLQSGQLPGLNLTPILIGSVVAAAVGWFLVRAFGAVLPHPKNPKTTGDLAVDIERFEAERDARRDGRFLATTSLVLPAIAVSLLAPLTIHWLFSSIVWGDTRDLDSWIRMSLAIVGHAHIALAIGAGRYMFKLSKKTTSEMNFDSGRGFVELFVAVGVSAVPGIIFIAIPPALVLVTGIAFVPFLWLILKRIAIHERSTLELAGIDIV